MESSINADWLIELETIGDKYQLSLFPTVPPKVPQKHIACSLSTHRKEAEVNQ